MAPTRLMIAIGFLVLFIKAGLLHPIDQSTSGYSEITGGLRLDSIVHVESIADQFFFHLVQRYAVSGQLEPDITKRLHRLGDRVRHISQGQAVFVRQHHHTLNKLFELADIPAEAVVRQNGDNIPADRKIFKSVLFLRSQKEVMKQKRDVLAASAKRRQVDGYDRE